MNHHPSLEVIDETSSYVACEELARALLGLMEEQAQLGKSATLILIDDVTMEQRNLRDRGEQRPTDVLAYPTWEPEDAAPRHREGSHWTMPQVSHLGDIFISLETAARQAAQAGHSLETEVKVLAAHGLTHLLGFDHQNAEEWKPFLSNQQRILEL